MNYRSHPVMSIFVHLVVTLTYFETDNFICLYTKATYDSLLCPVYFALDIVCSHRTVIDDLEIESDIVKYAMLVMNTGTRRKEKQQKKLNFNQPGNYQETQRGDEQEKY